MRYDSFVGAIKFLGKVGVKVSDRAVVIPPVQSLRVAGAIDYLRKSGQVVIAHEGRKEE